MSNTKGKWESRPCSDSRTNNIDVLFEGILIFCINDPKPKSIERLERVINQLNTHDKLLAALKGDALDESIRVLDDILNGKEVLITTNLGRIRNLLVFKKQSLESALAAEE